jgi:RNA polymerase sigma-70 factor (ECF subfamily)
MESPLQPGAEAAGDVSRLLRAWSDGDERALQKLLTLIYDELRRIAPRYMPPERPRLPLIFLVHEAFMCLVEHQRIRWQDRTLFFAVSAQLIRSLMVKHARRHSPVSADEATLIAFDDALNALARIDAREGQVVEMRLFGHLSFEETAEILRVPRSTVIRNWFTARAWLYCHSSGAYKIAS